MDDAAHVCVFRTDRIGDLLLTLPVAQAIHREYPHARITFCAQHYAAPLLKLSPHVDDVIGIAGRDASAAEAWKLRNLLHRQDFTHAVFAYPRPMLSAAAAAAGIPRRAGTAYRWYSFLYTDRVAEHRRDALQHESVYNLHLLRPLGVPLAADLHPVLEVNPELERASRNIIDSVGFGPGPYVVMHPGSGGSAKDWPAENFGRLAAILSEARPDLSVLITGTEAERPLMLRCLDASKGTASMLRQPVALDLLAGVLAGAAACVANSTGPLHLAAAVGTPVLGLYPFQRVCHPVRWGPMGASTSVLTPEPLDGCAACAVLRCPEHDDMRRIDPHTALQALLSLL